MGEQTLARDLLPAFGTGMMMLADRNFLSHTLARDMLATGAHLLWRASASFRLTPTEVLDDGTYLATLRPARAGEGHEIDTVHPMRRCHVCAAGAGWTGCASLSERG